MSLGGLVGEAVYEGDLSPFLPILAAGELVHVGKSTVFGNGLYRIQMGTNGRIRAGRGMRDDFEPLGIV